jgi:hypothetical protein
MASTPAAKKSAPSPRSAAGAAQAPIDPRVIDHIKRELPVPADFDSPQMRQLKRTALSGDKAAAFQLADFYSACTMHNKFFGKAPGRPDTPECLRAYKGWIRITAENGGSGAQRMLIDDALKSSRCEEVYRARFWFEKARKQGSEPEDAQIENEISEKEKYCVWDASKHER